MQKVKAPPHENEIFISRMWLGTFWILKPPQVGASLQTHLKKHLEEISLLSQTPQVGASLQTRLAFCICGQVSGLKPLKSGPLSKHVKTALRGESATSLKPLKSGPFPKLIHKARQAQKVAQSQTPQVGAFSQTKF